MFSFKEFISNVNESAVDYKDVSAGEHAHLFDDMAKHDANVVKVLHHAPTDKFHVEVNNVEGADHSTMQKHLDKITGQEGVHPKNKKFLLTHTPAETIKSTKPFGELGKYGPLHKELNGA